MPSSDPRSMYLVALAVAKLSFANLSTLSKYLSDDLQLGLIGFAVVLRTRRDWFVHIRDHGLDTELTDMVNEHKGVTTSTYEIAAYTGLNRNTVRRKLARLADIGLLERTADGRWHLRDFDHEEAAPAAEMLRELLYSYVTITRDLEAVLPEEVAQATKAAQAEDLDLRPYALLAEEMEEKLRRGHDAADAATDTSPPAVSGGDCAEGL